MEELTFGESTFFIDSFKSSIRDGWLNYLIGDFISNDALRDNFKSSITSWIGSTRFIRNSCAHHSRIYGVLLNAQAPKFSNIDYRVLKREGIKKSNNFTLFARMLAIKNLLSLNRNEIKQEWNSFLLELDEKIKNNEMIFENNLGFINNWNYYLKIELTD